MADVFWNLDLDDWILPSFIAVFALEFLHGRIFGKFVPAVCWGFFAVPDDDRLDTTQRCEPCDAPNAQALD
ncbi:hypothetical protein C2E31_23245 [Rhodopirellula baltica]|nr:hypothetical protein C2E31_23245 [Rhodopirellula baltica]